MATASYFSPVMAQLTGNQGGNVESLPAVTVNGGRQRSSVGVITLTGQPSGAIIGVARLPLGAALLGVTLTASVSLGSATVAVGDVNNGAVYAGATALTAPNTPTKVGNASALGVPISPGYDCTTGALSASYEDVVLTVGAAALPVGGTLNVLIDYAID